MEGGSGLGRKGFVNLSKILSVSVCVRGGGAGGYGWWMLIHR